MAIQDLNKLAYILTYLLRLVVTFAIPTQKAQSTRYHQHTGQQLYHE